MHTLVTRNIVESCFQLVTAIIITMVQRYLLELATIEEDINMFKRSWLYSAWQKARWYRGKELYHQWHARKVFFS